jgi:Spirocyclase AveC-like
MSLTAHEHPATGTTTRPVDAPVGAGVRRGWPPVVWWAIAGGAMVAFIAYVLIRWVTGPNFKQVPQGPSSPPETMKVALTIVTVLGIGLMLGCLYWFLVRPWRRDRRVSTDGLLVIAYGLLYVQDPWINASQYWFTYNSWQWNRGSWQAYMPFMQSYTAPGHAMAEPLLGMGPIYFYFWTLGIVLATWVFRTIKDRWPRLGTGGAILVIFALSVLFDMFFEAFIWLPIGMYSLPGGAGPRLFPSTYHSYPIIEGLLVGVLLVPYVLLRHYRNDKGETYVERGIADLKIGSKAKVTLRFLALVAVTQAFYFFFYNVWITQLGIRSHAWPADTQKRSYFLDGLCGYSTGRACPGPTVPNSRGNSAYLGTNGQIIFPSGATRPDQVPVIGESSRR